MPTLAAGNDIVVIKPTLWWAPRFTKLPAIGLPLGQDWATLVDPAWTKIKDTVNGIQVTNRNPVVPVVSEERDRIGSVRAGGSGGGRGGGGGGRAAAEGSGTAIAFQALTFTESFWLLTNQMSKITVAAATDVVSYTFTGAATTNGNITIGLGNADGITTTNTTVAVSTTTETSASAVATKVRGTAFTGFTTGGTGATVTFTPSGGSTTGYHGPFTFDAGTTGVTLQANDPTRTTVGHKGYSASSVDTDAEHTVMVGFEGIAKAGGLFSVDTNIRGFGYRCENSQNGMDVWRRTGADAVIKPNMVLECIPEDITSLTTTMIANTGITASSVDSDGKFNYFYGPA